MKIGSGRALHHGLAGSLLALLALLGITACAKTPAVTVEQAFTEHRPDPRADRRVFPPRCREFPPAIYPTDVPADERPERVDVRVDLVIDEYGRARHPEATVLNDVPDAGPFLEAAVIAAHLVHCEPAMRTPRPDSDEVAPVPIEYRSGVVFRFYRDERRVEVETGP